MTIHSLFSKKMELKEGIYSYNITNSTTKEVTGFYSVEPFPNYTRADNKLSIIAKGDANPFANQLKNFIGYKKSFLEVGAGTCQLSNYLAIGTNNKVCALDPTLESLKLGYKFAENNSISNASFIRADIFDDVLKHETMDVVLCSGVLHHTKDPKKGFEVILNYVKKNGIIVIGLYNKYGRLRTYIRKFLYKIFGHKFLMIIDPVLRKMESSDQRKINSWIRDQYHHPVESTHSFHEVIGWFKENGVNFIGSYPSCKITSDNKYKYFEKTGMGTTYEIIYQQIAMIFSRLGGEGGLFIFIGRKK